MATVDLPDSVTFVKPSIKRRLTLLSGAASLIVIAAGVLVLLGWIWSIESLKRIGSEYVAMNPLTAICFIFCGLGLWFVKNLSPAKLLLSRVISISILVVCSLKFVSLFIAWDYPLDRLLFAEMLPEQAHDLVNRMAPNTAFCFILAALAILFIDSETTTKKRPAQFLCVIITLVSLLSIYGYIYDVGYLIGIAAYIPMALNTALVFFILAVGLLFARPDKGSMLLIFSEDTGEKLFSRLVAIVLPLFAGWLKLQGEYAGYYSSEFGTAVFALLTYSITMFLLGRNATMKHKARKAKYKAELLFRENAQKLQAILDNTATPIYIKNKLGMYELVNAEFERVFHVKTNEVIGRTDFEFLPEEIATTIQEHDQEVLESGVTKHLEEIIRLNHEERTYLTVKFPLKDATGSINAVCSVATDITERKQMELQLRENEQRLNAILSGLGEGVVVVNPEGKFIFFNEVAEKTLGLGLTDAPIAEWSSRYGSFKPDGVTQFPPEELPLARGLIGESTDDVEIYVRNANIPEGRAISVTGRPVFNDQGEIIASVVVCRDITNEKHLEALIQENEKRLQVIISSIGEGIVIADSKGKLLMFNKNAENILGIGITDITITEWPLKYGVYKPDGLTPFPAEELPLTKALQGETTSGVEMLIRNQKFPQGKTISVTGRPITDQNGNITAGVVDFKDISEVKKLEKTLSEIKRRYKQIICKYRNQK